MLFDRLASSILSQQLSVKAAATIAGRLRDRASTTGHTSPTSARPLLAPDLVATLSDEELRACGISRPKVAALRDLADAVRSGRIPTLEVLRGYDDDDVINALTAVRGIGRWTAEMQLIFLLDRPDVLPLADVGVRRGFERVLGLEAKATPAQMAEHAQAWAPYRSVASWFLWRAVDQTGESAPPA
ncbi:DNA-3-methyladenine glycosylase family protein [Dietzia sp. NPDC055343]